MKKSLLIIAFATLFAMAASAQNYVNLGYGFCSNVIRFGDMDPESADSNALLVGVSHNFNLNDSFGLEAGLDYHHDYSWSEIGKKGKDGFKSMYHGIRVPALFNYKLELGSNMAVKLFLGPTAHFGLSDKTIAFADGKKTYDVNNYESDDNRRLGLSASAAVAVEWNVLRFKLGYDCGLTDLNASDAIKSNQNVVACTISYIF